MNDVELREQCEQSTIAGLEQQIAAERAARERVEATLKVLHAEVEVHRGGKFDDSWARQCEENWRLEKELAALKLKLEAAKTVLLDLSVKDENDAPIYGLEVAFKAREALAQLNGEIKCPCCGGETRQDENSFECDKCQKCWPKGHGHETNFLYSTISSHD